MKLSCMGCAALVAWILVAPVAGRTQGLLTNMIDAGDRLVETQNGLGYWSRPGFGDSLDTLTWGGLSLIALYEQTGDTRYRNAVAACANALLQRQNDFQPYDGLLAAELDRFYGVTTYTAHVRAMFYDRLFNDSYGPTNSVSTLELIAAFEQRRIVLLPDTTNRLPWDIGLGLAGAHACGVQGEAINQWIVGAQNQFNNMDGGVNAAGGSFFHVFGLAGGVYSLSRVGVDVDPTQGFYASANSLQDLVDALLTYQIEGGGFSYDRGELAPNSDNEQVQETYYSILALETVNGPLYRDQIKGAQAWLASKQLATGGFQNFDESEAGEDSLVTAVALLALLTRQPRPVIPDSLDFGLVEIGSTLQQAYRVENRAGAGESLFLDQFNAGNAIFQAVGTPELGPIAPGEFRDFVFEFAPTDERIYQTGGLILSNDPAGEFKEFNLRGEGTEALDLTGSLNWYFADGGSGANGDQTFVTVLNNNDSENLLTFALYFVNEEPLIVQYVAAANSRFTFRAHEELGIAGRPAHQSFAIGLTAAQPVFAERVMYSTGPESGIFRTAASAALGATQTRVEWLLAEGTSTIDSGGNQRFTLVNILNANQAAAAVEVRFLRQGDAPIVVNRTVPAQRRATVIGNLEAPNSDFSIRVVSTNGFGLVVDRTMIGSAESNALSAQWMHSTLALPGPANAWYFADGRQGADEQFETFFTIGNTNDVDVTVDVRFLLTDALPITETITVGANRRQTIIVSQRAALAGREFASEFIAQNGAEIVVERPMYWKSQIIGGPQRFGSRSAAAATVGASQLSENWFMPEGAVYGQSDFKCHIAAGNPSDTAALLDFEFITDQGQRVRVQRTLLPGRRLTVRAEEELVGLGTDTTISFSTIVRSTNDVPVVVDRTMFGATRPDQGGVEFYSGHASAAIPLQ